MSNNNNNSDRIYIILGVLVFLFVMSSCAALLIRHITKSDTSKKSSPSPSPSSSPSPSPSPSSSSSSSSDPTVSSNIDIPNFNLNPCSGKFTIKSGDKLLQVGSRFKKYILKLSEIQIGWMGWTSSSLDDTGKFRIKNERGDYLKDMNKDDAIRVDDRTVDPGIENWEFIGGEVDPNNSSIYNKVKIKSRYGNYLNINSSGSLKLDDTATTEWTITCED